ncbi:MAG TPA: hypothetical protein VNT53_06615 [Pseudolysinimonas sp.]|nr:hypothetical protein [Pseudolysinimonas sp.]
MSEYNAEVVHIRPTSADAREELLRIRPQMLAEYDVECKGKYSALLHEPEDGSFVDIWTWESHELAEYASRTLRSARSGRPSRLLPTRRTTLALTSLPSRKARS